MDISKTTSKNIRRIRESKKLTLDAAAALTGVSRSMLSQIERGDANPTITVLWKIANGFKVSFTSLTEPVPEETAVTPAEDVKPLTEEDGLYLNYPVFPFDEKRLFEMYRIVIRPEGSLEAEPHMSGTEEYITVYQGEAEITVDGSAYRLKTGDSIRFRSDVHHGYRNVGKETVQMNMLIYYNER